MRKEKKHRKAKRKEKKGEKEQKGKRFVERKGRKRRKEEGKRKDSRLLDGQSSTVQGLKLVHAARSTCGHQKVGVSTNSKR